MRFIIYLPSPLDRRRPDRAGARNERAVSHAQPRRRPRQDHRGRHQRRGDEQAGRRGAEEHPQLHDHVRQGRAAQLPIVIPIVF